MEVVNILNKNLFGACMCLSLDKDINNILDCNSTDEPLEIKAKYIASKTTDAQFTDPPWHKYSKREKLLDSFDFRPLTEDGVSIEQSQLQ